MKRAFTALFYIGENMAKNLNVAGTIAYDRSNLQTTTTTTIGQTITELGVKTSIYDKNLSTYYGATAGTEAYNSSVLIKIDYGSVLWNTQIYYKYNFSSQGRLDLCNNVTIDYSIDDTNWTNIKTITAETIYTENLQLMNFRYLRFYISSANNMIVGVKLYEVRVMGS